MTTVAFLREVPRPDERQIREMLAGNLCRCTGYQFIVEAIQAAAAEITPSAQAQGSGARSEDDGGEGRQMDTGSP